MLFGGYRETVEIVDSVGAVGLAGLCVTRSPWRLTGGRAVCYDKSTLTTPAAPAALPALRQEDVSMDPKVYKLLNDQINKEFYSAYLYLEIANYYDAKGLDGFANWYEIQEIGRASCRERV